ncbi:MULTISPECIES: YfjI family protein [unclassified Bartonella]|uniref:YfjI family protein n=1 Tax=unclassified Bartonella TaxID=2645622 RepID=UPI002360F227|nr:MULTISPECIES: YfjI family protein [unclassified Bartonella]
MTKDNQNILENNTSVNDNDNLSLNDNACLKAIPYEQALQQDGWGELKPIENALLPVEPFNPLQLPMPFMDYIYDVSERQQAPMDFIAVAALCGLAAVIGNGVRVAPKQYDDWTIVPNLWGALIGQSSTYKTPAMKAALAPITCLQKQWYKEWLKQKEKQEIEERLKSLDKREKERQANKALKKGECETARALLFETLSQDNGHDDDISRFIVNDVTVEKLGELLKENPRGLLMVRDELAGFLTNLERKEYQTDRAFYLTAFNGDDQFTYDRIERGTIFIPHVTLSIIGGIQPSRLIPLIQAIQRGINDDGLLQRFQMLVWPDENQEWKLVDRPPNQEGWQKYEGVFRSFRDKRLGSPEQPLIMRFMPKAQEKFYEWLENLHREAKGGHFSESLQSHVLKMPKTIASLALIFELLDSGRFEIGLYAITTALRWEKYLLSHVKRLYAAGDTVTAERAKLIVERCDCLPDVFTLRDIHQRSWTHLKDNQAVKQALELLCRCNYIRETSGGNSSKSGRPTIRYEWHPLVKSHKTPQ